MDLFEVIGSALTTLHDVLESSVVSLATWKAHVPLHRIVHASWYMICNLSNPNSPMISFHTSRRSILTAAADPPGMRPPIAARLRGQNCVDQLVLQPCRPNCLSELLRQPEHRLRSVVLASSGGLLRLSGCTWKSNSLDQTR